MRPLVLFDADCGFCTRSARAMTGRWVRADVEAVALQRVDLAALGLTREQCLAALHVVDGHAAFVGGDAIAQILRRAAPPWRVAGWLMTLPVIRPLVGRLYGWVARHRHRFPGGTQACELPKQR